MPYVFLKKSLFQISANECSPIEAIQRCCSLSKQVQYVRKFDLSVCKFLDRTF